MSSIWAKFTSSRLTRKLALLEAAGWHYWPLKPLFYKGLRLVLLLVGHGIGHFAFAKWPRFFMISGTCVSPVVLCSVLAVHRTNPRTSIRDGANRNLMSGVCGHFYRPLADEWRTRLGITLNARPSPNVRHTRCRSCRSPATRPHSCPRTTASFARPGRTPDRGRKLPSNALHGSAGRT